MDGATPSPQGIATAGEPPVARPLWRVAYDGLAFLLSAVLSPYIVIPVGTVGIVYARGHQNYPPATLLLWAGLSVFFSTVVPALYVLWGMRRGKITDVHVMEREQRFGPFFVAVVSSIFSALVLWKLGAPPSVCGLSVVIGANGIVLWAITSVYKISIHVSVLSAVVLAAVTLHPGFSPQAFWLVPALIWARSTRKRHSLKQGILGCLVACFITSLTLIGLHMGDRLVQMLHRAF